MKVTFSSKLFWMNFDRLNSALSKPKEVILDPQDEFPVILMEKLTHFGAINIEEDAEKEFYYGNSNLSLEEFAKSLLLKAIRKYEEYLAKD